MNIQNFHFIRPEWLLLSIPLVVLFGLLKTRRLKKRQWEAVCDIRLLPYLLLDKATKKNRWALFGFGFGGILAILAMAGPAWEKLPSPVFRSESALVIVLDLSASMDAQDVKPSRLRRAQFKIRDILNDRKDGQSALVVYAGDAFTVTPLTEDGSTIASNLSALNTALMPAGGSRTERGLGQAEQLLKQAGLLSGHILLISDGIDLERVKGMVRRLKSRGYLTSILAVGTEAGAPIPLSGGGFLKDSSGNIVIPRLPLDDLRQLAVQGGGTLHRMSTDNRDIKAIGATINQHPAKTSEQDSGVRIEQWQERGPWLLLLLLPIAALSFRKGFIAAFAAALYFPGPEALALSWDDLWATPDQQARALFNKGEVKKAAELFEDSKWKAAAQYGAGELEKALAALEGLEDSESIYNKGNALAKLGRFQEALQAFSKSLEQNPENQDARFNKELIEELLKNQQNSSSRRSEQRSEGRQPDRQGSENDDTGTMDRSKEKQQMQENGRAQRQNQPEQTSKSSDQPIPRDIPKQDPKPGDKQQRSGTEIAQAQSEEENKKTKSEVQQALTGEKAHSRSGSDRQAAKVSQSSHPDQPDESQQADEQWLRRIPDDPGRLLREKFRYQYSQRRSGRRGEVEYW